MAPLVLSLRYCLVSWHVTECLSEMMSKAPS